MAGAEQLEAREPASKWARAVEAHLGSRDVARVIYGAIIALALVVALEHSPPSAGQVAAAIIATGVAVGLAELYSEFVGTEARTRRHVDRAKVRELVEDAGAVTFGAVFPAVFFLLSAAGAMRLELAFTLAKWSGLGLIAFYGFVAARLAGEGRPRAVGQALAIAGVGGALVAVKALLH